MELNEIKERLEKRPHQWEIQQARLQQSKIRFNTDIILNRTEAGTAYFQFIAWVERLLKQDKFNRFVDLLQFPISNNELTDSIYSELQKALIAQDKVDTYVFKNDKAKSDWMLYKERFNKFWKHQAWNEFRRSINSFIVIDMPEKSNSFYTDVNYFFVDIDNVIDAEVDNENNCKYLIFKTSKGYAAYCDEYMRLFDENHSLIKEVQHNIGQTPARNFWTDTINSKSNINKKSAISGVLSDFEWLLFHSVNKKYLDLGNSYPIIYEYETDEDEGEYNSDDKPTSIEGDTKNKGRDLAGAGSHKTVPAPDDKNDVDLMNKPIHTETVDVGSLNYNTEEQSRLEKKIFTSCVGFGGEANNESAKNEKQIQSGFESRENVLKNIAANFAAAESWANDIVCKVRYGSSYVSNFIYGGSKFYLISEKELTEQYNSAESDIIKENINSQIIDVRFKKDDTEKQRAKILMDIDPLLGRTLEQTTTLYEKGGIGIEDFIIKQNFITFVKRFERENTVVTEYEPQKEYKERINLIINTFKGYAREQRQNLSVKKR